MELRDGTIQSLVIKNFLCHKYLKITFDKSIKFIVGHNGSGKSSILDALILGLGGRAINTQRFSHLKDFILSGAEFAYIEIKLKNSGPNAYKPEEYGSHITVIREIFASGSSTYTIKSASDEVKARRYATLEAILLAYNIQIDNPMSVLPQKLSKQFMDKKNKTEKYDLFKRATNLAQSEEHYEMALENCAKAKKIWENQKKICDDLEGEIKKWECIMQSFNSQERNRDEKKNLERELQWSEIAEKESALQIEKQKCETLHNELLQRQDAVTRITSTLDSEHMKEIIDKKRNHIIEKNSLKDEKERLENMLNKLELDYANTRNLKSQTLKVIEREQRKIEDFKRQISDTMSGSLASQRAALEAEAEEARGAERAAHARLSTADDHLRQADAALEHARRADDEAARELRGRESEHAELEHNVQSIQRERGSLVAYGECAARLAQRVRDAAAAGHFKRAPRGPVGAYLTVEDETWSSALEQILGAAIKSYCVDNSEDARKLFALIGEVYGNSHEPRPSVSCCEFLPRPHDTRAREVRADDAQCALRALRIADPVVHNYLVDELALEAVLLVRDDERAMRLCRAAPPAHLRRAVTADCAEYLPAPRYRCYGGEAAPPRFLHASAEHALRELRRRLDELAARVAASGAARWRAAAALQAAAAARDEARAARRALHADLQRAEAAARRARDQLAQLREPQLAQLREELALSEERLACEREKLSEINQNEQRASDDIQQTKRELNDVAARLQTVNSNIENIEKEIEQLESEHNNSQSKVDNLKKKIDMYKANLHRMTAEVRHKETQIEHLVRELSKAGPRFENPREKHVVLSLLQQKEAEISSYAAPSCTAEAAAAQLAGARRRHATVTRYLRDLDSIIHEMTSMVRRHQKTCLARQKAVILYVQNRLTKIMHMRKVQGTLRIDPVSKSLEVSFAGRASGGENTFAMLALLLALQDFVDLPFFFMDEFDVFLDGVNQETAVRFLLESARKRPACQYIFITPNAPDGLRAAPDLDIQTLDVLPAEGTSK